MFGLPRAVRPRRYRRAIMRARSQQEPARNVGPAGRAPWAAPLGAAATGVLGGTFVIVARRSLSLEDMAPVAQLWTLWAIFAALFTFSFQQWAVITDDGVNPWHASLRGTPGRVLIRATALATVVGMLAGPAIFTVESRWWAILAGFLPVGCAAIGIGRGLLSSRRQAVHLGVMIPADNLIRVSGAVLLVVFGLDQPLAFAVAIIAGFAGSLLAWWWTRMPVTVGPGADRGQKVFEGAATAGLLSHAMVAGSPVLMSIAGADATEISTVFLLLTAARVPYLVAQGVVPTLAAHLRDGSADPRGLAVRVGASGLAATVFASLVAALVGQFAMDLVFGLADVSRRSLALATAAAVLGVTSLLITVITLTFRSSRAVIAAWGIGLTFTAIAIVAGGLTTTEPAVSALAAGEGVSFVLLVVIAMGTQIGPDRPDTLDS